MLFRSLMNLLSNAVKFTAKNGAIRVTTRELPNQRISVSVEDDGRGIPADQIAQLGEPFLQLGNPYLHDQGGSGLGLAICKALLRAMNGELQIESEVGHGTKVTFVLNAWTEAEAEAAQKAAAAKKGIRRLAPRCA